MTSDIQPSPDSHPPLTVVGIDTPMGLTVVREIGQRGVKVFGVAGSRRGLGLYSRYLHRGHCQPALGEPLIRLLETLAEEHGCRLLMAVGEAQIAALNVHRDRLARCGYRLLIPDAERMAKVVDKRVTLACAQRLGIAVPQEWPLTGPEDASGVEPAAFPLVLKWPNPHAVIADLNRHGLKLRKSEFCHTREELRRALERYRPLGRYPLAQRFCPGYGLGQMFYMADGEALLTFQHRRLLEWPPEGGASALCESLPLTDHARLRQLSQRLLAQLNWHGPAMVEYRYDPAQRRAVLMEINGRFWGSQPLAYHARGAFCLAPL